MNKNPSVLGFLVLLFSLTFLYAVFMGPLAVGSYYAFKNGNDKQYSDSLIRNFKKKITVY